MNKLSFFFKHDHVYEMTMKALQRRKFMVVESDRDKGIIKAKKRNGLLKPGIDIELHIFEDNPRQTSMNIESKTAKSWIGKEGYINSVEAKFIRTLYNCFDTI